MIYSPLYLAWAQVARIACMRAHHGQNTYDGLIEAHFNFTFKNHQSESDLSNCLEGIQDILQTAGVIKDDKQIRCIVAKKHFGGDPCTTVHLFPYEASHV